MLNYSANPVESDLYVIAGDAEAGGSLVDTLKVILANLKNFQMMTLNMMSLKPWI